LAMNFSRISGRKLSESMDLSPKQEDKYRNDARKECVYLLQSE
jgi:hypothetical protein